MRLFYISLYMLSLISGSATANLDGQSSINESFTPFENETIILEATSNNKSKVRYDEISTLSKENDKEQVKAKIVPTKNILFGVLGIGRGHISRQLPQIKYFLNKEYKVAVIGFGQSYDFFMEMKKDYNNLFVYKIDTPLYWGGHNGIDFNKAANEKLNEKNFIKQSTLAFASIIKEVGVPDIVVSDYEMYSAQLSYIKNIPLITYDQQSKLIFGEFPEQIRGSTPNEEIERLRMIFPKASKRLITSFFNFEILSSYSNEKIVVLPPAIRDEIISLKHRKLPEDNSIVVYATANVNKKDGYGDWYKILESLNSETRYHMFLPKSHKLPDNIGNVSFYHHGDKRFEELLGRCRGVIATAGHNLMSEAMYLEKPVYALPLNTYEQQISAKVIGDNRFGVSETSLTVDKLMLFLSNINKYKENIKNDKIILNKNVDPNFAIKEIEAVL